MSVDQNKRVQRVQRELFEILSQFLQHEMPEGLPCYAAISATEVSPDLRRARIFFRLIGDAKDVKETERLLEAERASFQRHVAHSLEMKFTPVLSFEYGVAPSTDPVSAEIDQLFANLHKPKFSE